MSRHNRARRARGRARKIEIDAHCASECHRLGLLGPAGVPDRESLREVRRHIDARIGEARAAAYRERYPTAPTYRSDVSTHTGPTKTYPYSIFKPLILGGEKLNRPYKGRLERLHRPGAVVAVVLRHLAGGGTLAVPKAA